MIEYGPNSARKWAAVIKAALAYFAIVFFCAFLFGIFRVLVLAPALGKTNAVLIEIPIVLTISWLSAAFLTGWFGIPRNLTQRLAMGGVAFVITMLAEGGFSIFVFAQPPYEFFESFLNLAGVLGLAGQIGFALIPAIQLASKRG